MPHFPKPFYRRARGLWYVQVAGRQINLGPDREAAFRRYHELMGQPLERHVELAHDTVVGIFDVYLDWALQHRARATYDWYLVQLTAFAQTLPTNLTVSRLRPYHLQEYLDGKTNWSNGSKRNAIVAVKRALNWAEKQGRIDRNPLRNFERPEGGRRELIVSPETHQEILSLVADPEFRDLLTAAWHTGARPQELMRVEARHVDLKQSRWMFPRQESKGKKCNRVVYLPAIIMDLTRRLMLKWPTGPLFRNACGRPWTAEAVNCRFVRIQHSLGKRVLRERGIQLDPQSVSQFTTTLKPTHRVQGQEVPKTPAELRMEARDKLGRRLARQYAPKYCLYNWRHSFATRMLEAGVDSMIVSTLMGHADTTMLGRVYSHVSQNASFLRDVLDRTAG